MSDFFDDLSNAAGIGRVVRDEPMNKHTTFKVGGPAGYFVTPENEEALRSTVLLCRANQKPYYILGNGSNLLVSDRGYDGVMISIGGGFSSVSVQGDTVFAGAGALLSKIAREALLHELAGLEFAAGIPGTLGGAVVMNAGAYDGEMKQVLKAVRVMKEDGTFAEISAEELELGYRHSCVPENGWIVLSAEIGLRPGKAQNILNRMDELAAKRREKQPLEYPSAGSTFKRPEGHFAGTLIQEAGLRGYRVGGAEVSEKHCGFIINRDRATAEDIRTLCRHVQKKVKETSGVELDTEVKMIGWD